MTVFGLGVGFGVGIGPQQRGGGAPPATDLIELETGLGEIELETGSGEIQQES